MAVSDKARDKGEHRMKKTSLFLFHSTHHVLKAEKVFKQNGISVEVIPVPRDLSSNCGVSLRIARTDQVRAAELLEANRVPVEGIHQREE
jgi:hypothetical protein